MFWTCGGSIGFWGYYWWDPTTERCWLAVALSANQSKSSYTMYWTWGGILELLLVGPYTTERCWLVLVIFSNQYVLACGERGVELTNTNRSMGCYWYILYKRKYVIGLCSVHKPIMIQLDSTGMYYTGIEHVEGELSNDKIRFLISYWKAAAKKLNWLVGGLFTNPTKYSAAY